MKEACAAWNLADKEPAQVTDNATNIVLAGVKAEMSSYLLCVTHTINLATQKVFNVNAVAKVIWKSVESGLASFIAASSKCLHLVDQLPAYACTLKDKVLCEVEDTVELITPVKPMSTSIWEEDERPTLSIISPCQSKASKEL